ncbi:hypothetical protein [Rhodococcus sp. NCIMB 12038]|uniref:hypothetical protein n=1 Tax=Rhodococcus sp. NCIMB 12038 TaxID=933800 RepID=UPI000B3CC6B7|nr:hypothetical protein [Rhodococcus sp. NCIMB 12038]OUS97225.1 hypothetical protein CA951_02450 [Rhodococcus sp. NCIMB 12038]
MSTQKSKTAGSFHADVTDTKKEQARKFLKRNVLVIVAAIVFATTYLVLGGISSDREADLSSQRSEILSLKGQLSMNQDQLRTEQGAAVEEATGGMEIDHKDDDDQTITALMKTALTWNGLSDYLDRREEVMKTYGFAEDSQFMQVFMPGEQAGVRRTAPSGKTYEAFDKDMRSEFVSLNSSVTDTAGDVYSYFSIVEMRVASGSGATSSTAYVSLRYDMIDGKPTNLDAYTIPGGVERSG